MEEIRGLVLLLFIGIMYFLPALVANGNKKSNSGAILVLNLLLGWTVLGWIVAMVWAVTKDTKPTTSVIVVSGDNLFCMNCGAQIIANAAFCIRCGAKAGTVKHHDNQQATV